VAPVLRGALVTLRPAEPRDAERLTEVLTHPEVARWWHGFDLERVSRELTGGDDETVVFAAHNQRAIRSYRRVGFRPVGIMRRYERGADGTWRDGLLMDLLPEDLR
jgi:ribosomal protein S18 acetylase RimI-like enzyme